MNLELFSNLNEFVIEWVMGQRLDIMTSELFSNLNDSVINVF